MWTPTLICCLLFAPSLAINKKYNITVGYIPSIEEITYFSGHTLSDTVSLALDEINNSTTILPDVHIMSQLVTKMTASRVHAFFSPEHFCRYSSFTAHRLNLPMVAIGCRENTPITIPSFVNWAPPTELAIKSVISVLKYYRWHRFSIFYERDWADVAVTLNDFARKTNMTINHLKYVDCCRDRSVFQNRFLEETKINTKIYVYLGSPKCLVEMMNAMESLQLFAHGEYMVIFVDMTLFTSSNTLKYFTKRQDLEQNNCPESEDFLKRSRSLLVVTNSASSGNYEEFYNKVQNYENNLLKSVTDLNSQLIKYFSTYLYDSIYLYATVLNELIHEDADNKDMTYQELLRIATNGSRIINRMKQITSFKSVSGASIRVDMEKRFYTDEDFSLLAFKPTYRGKSHCDYGMVPVGYFAQASSSDNFPQYKLSSRSTIDWAVQIKPDA